MTSENISERPLNSPERRCPRCNAVIADEFAKTCPTCRAELNGSEALSSLIPPPRFEDYADVDIRVARPIATPGRIAVGVLSLVICFLFALQVPGMLVVLLILVVPALIRTSVTGIRRQRRGDPLIEGGRWGIFFATIGTMVLVFMAICVALMAICAVIAIGVSIEESSQRSGSIGTLAGLVFTWVAIPVAVLIYEIYRRAKK